ncbi:MAG: DNA-directed RNA polymerase subunit alpha C-terminal domain-containing protein [Chroococcales cyanobacterium]
MSPKKLQWLNHQGIPIELLQLNIQTYKALKNQGVNTVNDLLNYSQEELSQLPGITPKRREEIVTKLAQQLGINLDRA